MTVGPAAPEPAVRLRALANVVAPTTVIVALLYYYGYVTTHAYFDYFGIDLEILRLGQRDLVLRSVAALYAPAVGCCLLLALLWLARVLLLRTLRRTQRRRVVRVAAVATVGLGLVLVGRGLVGMLVPEIARTELPTLTPLSLGLGVLLIGAGAWTAAAVAPGAPAERVVRVDPTAAGLVAAVVVLSLFWTTNTVASAYGRGAAEERARDLGALPAVVLDSPDRLGLLADGVEETALPKTAGQRFAYRYRGLRLLVVAGGRLYLLPETWSEQSGVVVMLPDDASVRVQFRR